jgi:hypothetical protein
MPYKKIPKTVRVPFFTRDSLAQAHVEARSVAEIYRQYEPVMSSIIASLKTQPEARKEFLDNISRLATEKRLRKYGLPVDILPHVINKIDEDHEGVPYTIYEMKGGELGGAKDQWYWAFISGIQLPHYAAHATAAGTPDNAQDALQLAFNYALYSDPLFMPNNEILTHLTPRLITADHEEAQIAEYRIPAGKVVPHEISKDLNRARQSVRTAISAYNAHQGHQGQLLLVAEKLGEPQVKKQLSDFLGGIHVNNYSDGVAKFLGSLGARYILESEYHLRREAEQEKWRQNIRTRTDATETS